MKAMAILLTVLAMLTCLTACKKEQLVVPNTITMPDLPDYSNTDTTAPNLTETDPCQSDATGTLSTEPATEPTEPPLTEPDVSEPIEPKPTLTLEPDVAIEPVEAIDEFFERLSGNWLDLDSYNASGEVTWCSIGNGEINFTTYCAHAWPPDYVRAVTKIGENTYLVDCYFPGVGDEEGIIGDPKYFSVEIRIYDNILIFNNDTSVVYTYTCDVNTYIIHYLGLE